MSQLDLEILQVNEVIAELRSIPGFSSYPVEVTELIEDHTPLAVVSTDDLNFGFVRQFATDEYSLSIEGESDVLPLEGYILATRFGGAIFLNSITSRNNSIHRQRFSAAHELGHYFLDARPLFETDRNLQYSTVACTPNDVGLSSQNSRVNLQSVSKYNMERRANLFAAELLMPTAEVMNYALTAKHKYPLDAIKKISNRFGSSMTASAYRYIATAEHSCALVYSVNGIIVNYAPSRSLEKLGFEFKIKKGSRIQFGTIAFNLFSGRINKYHDDWGKRYAKMWFPEYAGDCMLHEHSMCFGEGRAVMTIIWF